MKPFLARNKIVLPLLFFVFGILSTEWINISWKALTFLSSILVLLTFYNSKYKYLLFISLGILISSQTPPDPNHIESFKNKKADIEGILFKSIERREDSSRLYLQVHSVISNNKKYNVNVKVIVTVNDHLYGIYKGHRIRVLNVKLKEFKNYNNPGKFDVKKFYNRKAIYFKGFISDVSDIISFGKESNSYSLLENVERRRGKFAGFIRKNLTFPSSEIYTALTIGEKKGIPSELRDNFSSLGISHLLAISGLHLGAIALIFYFIFDWLLKRSEWILLTYLQRAKDHSSLNNCSDYFLYVRIRVCNTGDKSGDNGNNIFNFDYHRKISFQTKYTFSCSVYNITNRSFGYI